jgi:C_GCAxxG_C_C family probable redox protein
MNKINEAVECFKNGFNCSQAVFSTYCEVYGIDKKTALKIATSFGGGMGHTGETCGAVTGAFMLLGLIYGKYRADDEGSKEKTYTLVQEFTDRFKKLNGSVRCTELIGHDLSTKDGVKNAKLNNVFETLCPKYVKDSAEIVQKLIEQFK